MYLYNLRFKIKIALKMLLPINTSLWWDWLDSIPLKCGLRTTSQPRTRYKHGHVDVEYNTFNLESFMAVFYLLISK